MELGDFKLDISTPFLKFVFYFVACVYWSASKNWYKFYI